MFRRNTDLSLAQYRLCFGSLRRALDRERLETR
jgi:hypothetical protein